MQGRVNPPARSHTMPPFIQKDVPLAPMTTLGVGGTADYFAPIHTDEELREAVAWAQRENLSIYVLGGGANTFVRDSGVRGLVIHLMSEGVIFEEMSDHVLVHADAGVALDALIARTVEEGLWGIENLSHIPSTLGAFPVQNVGAYGVEAKDVISYVRAYDMETDTFHTFTNGACEFAYRESIFTHTEGKRYVITQVTLRVTRTENPRLGYKDLEAYFNESPTAPTLALIREAIIAIRTKKLPDWNVVGTAGSFFKNPIISRALYESLKVTYAGMPSFPEKDDMVKIPLGWVLDHVCGLRGYRDGNVWLHENQALVLVCEKRTASDQVDLFIEMVKRSVKEKIGIDIEAEVRVME